MTRRFLLLGLTASLLVATTPPALAQDTPRRIRGTVEALDGSTLLVRSREGESVRVALAPGYTVAAVVPAELSAIKPGTYVGTARITQATSISLGTQVRIGKTIVELRK